MQENARSKVRLASNLHAAQGTRVFCDTKLQKRLLIDCLDQAEIEMVNDQNQRNK